MDRFVFGPLTLEVKSVSWFDDEQLFGASCRTSAGRDARGHVGKGLERRRRQKDDALQKDKYANTDYKPTSLELSSLFL